MEATFRKIYTNRASQDGMADKGLGRRALLFLILVLSIFGPLSTDMFLSGLPKMTVDFSAPESVMNMSLYLFMLAFAISILVLGPLSDKYGRRKILLITMSIYAVASVACCLTDNVWAFIAFRIVQAFGGGGAMCTAFALIKDCFTGEEMKSALSITAALGILGPILAPVIGTVLINISGWRATFWALTAVSLLCLSMGCLLPGNLPEERHEGSVIGALSRIKVVAGDRHFVLFMVMMCVFMAGQLAYISVSAYVFEIRFGLGTTEYSLVLAASCIFGLMLAAAIGRLKLSPRKSVAAILLLGLSSFALMLAIGGIHWAGLLLAIIPCCAVSTITRSFGFGILMGQRDGDNGSVSSTLNFTGFIAAFFGMIIASSFPSDLFVEGIATTLGICCLIYLACWAALRKDGYPLKGLE